MALILCDQCGEKIAKSAKACPKCGNTAIFDPYTTFRGLTILLAVAVVAGIAAAFYFGYDLAGYILAVVFLVSVILYFAIGKKLLVNFSRDVDQHLKQEREKNTDEKD